MKTPVVQHRFSAISCLFSTLLFLSCTGPTDHSAEIKTLDSLLTAVESAHQQFEQIDKGKVQLAMDSVTRQVKYLEQNYVGEMDRSLAQKISIYAMIAKEKGDYARELNDVQKEYPTTINQLTGLKKALEEGATIDATGNKIDDVYVQTMMNQETALAGSLLDQMQEVIRSSKLIIERYDSLAPVLQPVFDSIPIKVKE